MTETYKVALEVTGANKASPVLQTVKRDLDGVGTAAQRTGGLLSGMQGMLGGLFAGASVAGVVRFAEGLNTLGAESNRASNLFASFGDRIGDTESVMDRLRDVTRGAVSDLGLMNGANQLLGMGLAKNADELTKVTQIAGTFAQAMGTDVNESISQFALLMANQSYERLDALGISAGEVRALATEYRAAGMSSADAFNQAVMVIAEGMLPQMSAVADASVTELSKLQTRMENVGAEFAERFAGGFNSALGFALDLTSSMRNDSLVQGVADQLLRENGISFASAEDAAEADRQAALLVDRYGIAFAEMVRVGELSIDQIVAQFRRNDLQTAVEDVARAVRNNFGDAFGGMVSQSRLQPATGRLNQSYGELEELLMSGRGFLDGQSLFNPDELLAAEMAAAGVNNALREMERMAADGLVADADVERFREMADRAGLMADNVRRGADAFKDMTLDQALFGNTDANELLGGLAGGIDTSNWTQEQIDQLALLTGNATEASIALREAQEQISAMSPDDALVALQGLETITRAGAMQDATPEQLAEAYGAFQGRGFNPELMGAVEYASGIDLTQAAEDSAAIWDNMGKVATEVEGISSALDEVFDARYTLSIEPQFVGGNAQILQALFGPNWAQNVVRAGTTGNNGNVPGANTDSNSRSTPPPTAPVMVP